MLLGNRFLHNCGASGQCQSVVPVASGPFQAVHRLSAVTVIAANMAHHLRTIDDQAPMVRPSNTSNQTETGFPTVGSCPAYRPHYRTPIGSSTTSNPNGVSSSHGLTSFCDRRIGPSTTVALYGHQAPYRVVTGQPVLLGQNLSPVLPKPYNTGQCVDLARESVFTPRARLRAPTEYVHNSKASMER